MAKNPYLKSANEVMEYTSHQVSELQKCMDDPVYFAQNYVQIQHPVRGSIPVELYDYQKRMLHTFKDNRNTIILSARQTGKCLTLNTSVTLVDSSCISLLKRCILWIFDRRTYHELFSKTMQNMQY